MAYILTQVGYLEILVTDLSIADIPTKDHDLLDGLGDDDHSKYPLVTNFETDRATIVTNWTDLTDGGETALHTHAGGAGVDTSGSPEALDFARFTDADTIEGRSYAEVKADLSLEIGTDVLAQQTIGIADNNLVEIDHAGVADNDFAKFTAGGLEGRSYAETLSDISAMGLAGGTFTGAVEPYDHGAATSPEIVAVVYGTTTPPTASATPIGTLWVKYTA